MEEAKFKITIDKSDLDFITFMIDVTLKTKGIEYLDEVNKLKNSIQKTIIEEQELES